jgi:hypothetical protein
LTSSWFLVYMLLLKVARAAGSRQKNSPAPQPGSGYDETSKVKTEGTLHQVREMWGCCMAT